jgi:AraC family transcriptional regulator
MAGETGQEVRWKPLIYFWDTGWFGVGPSRGEVPLHSHHAIQIALGLDGPVRFRNGDGPWVEYAGAAVKANAPHAFDGAGSVVAMVFLDPRCHEGVWLTDSLRSPVAAIPAERFAAYLPRLRGFPHDRPGAEEATELITGLVRSLCSGPPPLRRMDERITRALAWIHERDAGRLSLEAVAKAVFLSPSRFAHLFSDEMGIPFRRYVLWRRLRRAMEEFAKGSTFSAAAHAAGFSDSAHLTRTFYQMFGVPPTAMIGQAEFYEIPAPFQPT